MNELIPNADLSADQTKKVYVKPLIREIRLVAEEAVLSLCKQNNAIYNVCMPDISCYGSTARS
jgi:hypothetical protein